MVKNFCWLRDIFQKNEKTDHWVGHDVCNACPTKDSYSQYKTNCINKNKTVQ